MKTEMCPLCSGSGELKGDDISKCGYVEIPGEARICHGCGGDGKIYVFENKEPKMINKKLIKNLMINILDHKSWITIY